jgi:hypothetical protein
MDYTERLSANESLLFPYVDSNSFSVLLCFVKGCNVDLATNILNKDNKNDYSSHCYTGRIFLVAGNEAFPAFVPAQKTKGGGWI